MPEVDAIDRLKELVQDSGMPVIKFAEKAEINQSNLSSVLRRKRNLGGNIIMKVCSAFNVNPIWLTRGEGEKYRDENYKIQNMLAESSFIHSIPNTIDYREKYIKKLEEHLELLEAYKDSLQKELDQKTAIIDKILREKMDNKNKK